MLVVADVTKERRLPLSDNYNEKDFLVMGNYFFAKATIMLWPFYMRVVKDHIFSWLFLCGINSLK